MAHTIPQLISIVRSCVHSLLYDDVIEQTIVVMSELHSALNQLATRIDSNPLTEEQKQALANILLPLVSESIREALHKNELSITNGIIRAKNRILEAIGVTIPDGHEEIDPADYPNYRW